jgi:hypothetical protein
MNPHEIDWQVSMFDIRCGEIEVEQGKWDSQKQQQTLEIQIQQEKGKTQKQQQTHEEYKFDLMVKYKKLQEQGFDNHQIVKMMTEMRSIIDNMASMPIHLQLSPVDDEEEE